MDSQKINSNNLYSRLIDLIVIAASFLLFSVVTEFAYLTEILGDTAFYVAFVFITLRLCKRIVSRYFYPTKSIISELLGNLTGFFVSVVLLLLLNSLLPLVSVNVEVVIFSSILAFFILGTLAPMLKSTHRDIIHH